MASKSSSRTARMIYTEITGIIDDNNRETKRQILDACGLNRYDSNDGISCVLQQSTIDRDYKLDTDHKQRCWLNHNENMIAFSMRLANVHPTFSTVDDVFSCEKWINLLTLVDEYNGMFHSEKLHTRKIRYYTKILGMLKLSNGQQYCQINNSVSDDERKQFESEKQIFDANCKKINDSTLKRLSDAREYANNIEEIMTDYQKKLIDVERRGRIVSEREKAIDEREKAIYEREKAIDEREKTIDEREKTLLQNSSRSNQSQNSPNQSKPKDNQPISQQYEKICMRLQNGFNPSEYDIIRALFVISNRLTQENIVCLLENTISTDGKTPWMSLGSDMTMFYDRLSQLFPSHAVLLEIREYNKLLKQR